MSERSFELFDEYAAAYARGDRPDTEAYLERAGSDRNELAKLLDAFLRGAPAPLPNEDDRRLLGLMIAEEPPLLALRVARGLRVDDMVEAVVGRLGLDRAKRSKVKRYYQRLEGGFLDPEGLSEHLRAVLTDILGSGAEVAMAWTAPPPEAAAPAFLRRADYLEIAPTAAEPAVEAEDEIDRLFTGGS